ncbi:hypothetical protein KY284_031822 [Solanum tuberosum]|nr:hypothetical protein KY284_031822 [Solanum tuberosum]
MAQLILALLQGEEPYFPLSDLITSIQAAAYLPFRWPPARSPFPFDWTNSIAAPSPIPRPGPLCALQEITGGLGTRGAREQETYSCESSKKTTRARLPKQSSLQQELHYNASALGTGRNGPALDHPPILLNNQADIRILARAHLEQMEILGRGKAAACLSRRGFMNHSNGRRGL